MKFNPETCERIVQAVREGNYLETSARLAGVGKTTLYEWLKKGRESPESPYGAFVVSLETAEGEGEATAVKTILDASQRTWMAAAWFLERKYPGRWGRKVEVKDGDDKGEKPAGLREWLDTPAPPAEPAH